MYNLKIYQICHDLIAYFATLTSPKKSQLGLIFRTEGSILQNSGDNVYKKQPSQYFFLYISPRPELMSIFP